MTVYPTKNDIFSATLHFQWKVEPSQHFKDRFFFLLYWSEQTIDFNDRNSWWHYKPFYSKM